MKRPFDCSVRSTQCLSYPKACIHMLAQHQGRYQELFRYAGSDRLENPKTQSIRYTTSSADRRAAGKHTFAFCNRTSRRPSGQCLNRAVSTRWFGPLCGFWQERKTSINHQSTYGTLPSFLQPPSQSHPSQSQPQSSPTPDPPSIP